MTMADTQDDGIPKRLKRWTTKRVFLVSWATAFSALFINALMMAVGAKMWGHENFPTALVLWACLPVSVICAVLLTRWIRGLITEAEAY